MKRKYTKVKHFEATIFRLRDEGKTRREIADDLGLSLGQIKNLINRYNRRNDEQTLGKVPKKRGRPRKHPITTLQKLEIENKQLKMEVELLRSFLQAAGRR